MSRGPRNFTERIHIVARPEEKEEWLEACRVLKEQTGERWSLCRFMRMATNHAAGIKVVVTSTVVTDVMIVEIED